MHCIYYNNLYSVAKIKIMEVNKPDHGVLKGMGKL